MRGLILKGLDQPLVLEEIPVPAAGPGEVVVQLQAAALNKRDYWITKGKYPGITFPLVLGSDGAGWYRGKPVIINPSLGWGPDPDYFSPEFRILGMPDQGTLAEYVVVPEPNLFPKPEHLSWEEAAALPVCGVTAYRALFTRGQAKAGERVLITGIGGGVASMALLFSVSAGLEVWVSSSSDQKINRAVQLGATGGVNYSRPQWSQELTDQLPGKLDLVVDGAGGPDFSKIVPAMHNRGRMVIYGGTRGMIENLSPQRIFWKQLDILGTTMGSSEDFSDMIQFVDKHKIKPVVSHLFNLSEGNDALALLAKSEQFGKVCIRVAE